MTRNAWAVIPEIDNEMMFNSDPSIGYQSRFPFSKLKTYDLLNVFFKVTIDPNVLALYRIFLKDIRGVTKKEVQQLVNNLMERYNPGYNNE